MNSLPTVEKPARTGHNPLRRSQRNNPCSTVIKTTLNPVQQSWDQLHADEQAAVLRTFRDPNMFDSAT
jgi:hypothetical protein